jgi:hypothetical protein
MKKGLRVLLKCVLLIITILFLIAVVIYVSNGKKANQEKVATGINKNAAKESPQESKIRGPVISAFPRDGEFLRRLDQPLYIHFSETISPNDFSFEASPDPGRWDVSWKRRGKLAILEHKNPFQAGAACELRLVVKSIKKETIVRFTAYGPSSLDLIEQNEKRALVDVDTAWTYRLQAIFDPDQLPLKYQSPTPLLCGTGVMRNFWKMKSELRPETLRKLESYLVPPSHPDSVFSQERIPTEPGMNKNTFSLVPRALAQGTGPQKLAWEKPLKCSSAPIKIWFHKGFKNRAEEARDYIDMGNYYGKFKDVMTREPLSDAGELNNGGDGDIDFYFVALGDDGVCESYRKTRITPAYILINQSIRGAELDATVAHELFHAFQFAFDSDENEWWAEGTAVWAENYADPYHNREQGYLSDAFQAGQNRLETLTDDGEYHPYGIYLFPYYLSHQFGDKKIGEIWKDCESKEALNAVEHAVGDFNMQFKKFAYLDSDIGPTQGAYVDYNGPLKLYDYHSENEINLDPAADPEPGIDMELPPLSATYYRFDNKCDPGSTPHIRFDLKDFLKNDKITVQAIIDPEGQPKEEDWSDRDERSFCINDKEENFKSIALTVASAERESTVVPTLKIELDSAGCNEGQLVLTYTYDDDCKHETATVLVGFAKAETSLMTGPDQVNTYYPVESVSILKARASYTCGEKIKTGGAFHIFTTPGADYRYGKIMLLKNTSTEKVTDVIFTAGSCVEFTWSDGYGEVFCASLTDDVYKVTGGDGISTLSGGAGTCHWKLRRRKGQ